MKKPSYSISNRKALVKNNLILFAIWVSMQDFYRVTFTTLLV